MNQCPNCAQKTGQPRSRYAICPGCHEWYDNGAGWTTHTDEPESPYDYESARDALTYYVWASERVSSPTVESAMFTETAILDDAWNVTEWTRVQTPMVDGGVGSVREDRLCALHDLEACLPDDEEQRVALLAGGIWSRRVAAEQLGESEHWVRSRGGKGFGVFRARLLGRGMIGEG